MSNNQKIAPAEGKFGAYLPAGISAAHRATINPLVLLFEKIHIPLNFSVIKNLVDQLYLELLPTDVQRLETRFFIIDFSKSEIRPKENCNFSLPQIQNLSEVLAEYEDQTDIEALRVYLKHGLTLAVIAHFYENMFFDSFLLFKDVLTCDLFDDGVPVKVSQREDGIWEVHQKQTLSLPNSSEEAFKIEKYQETFFPVITKSKLPDQRYTSNTKALATILAMKSASLVFPDLSGVSSTDLLEIRSELSSSLPLYWAAMLKLAKKFDVPSAKEADVNDLLNAAKEFVDAEVLPSVLEISANLSSNRLKKILRIAGPVIEGAKLCFGLSTMNGLDLAIAALDASGQISMKVLKQIEQNVARSQEHSLSFLLKLAKNSSRLESSKAGPMLLAVGKQDSWRIW